MSAPTDEFAGIEDPFGPDPREHPLRYELAAVGGAVGMLWNAEVRFVKWEDAARAFKIADEQMFIALESYGVKGDDHGTYFGLCDKHCGAVNKLAAASDELREAVEWLVARGYVELAKDEVGEHIVVLRRPGE